MPFRFRILLLFLLLSIWTAPLPARSGAAPRVQTSDLAPFDGTIMDAVNRGNSALIQRMLRDNPALVAYKGQNGRTLLQQATRNGQLDLVQLLIANGANVNAKRNDGSEALTDAAATGRLPIAQLLIEKGADVNSTEGNGDTALMQAATSGSVEIARLLIDHGANVNARRSGTDGFTALHCAAWEGHANVARFLVEKGADVTIKSNDGNMAIHKAANNGRDDAVLALVAAGCDINAPNIDGNTPLHVAAWFGQKIVVQRLLSVGADIHARNKAGETPRDIAARNNQREIVAVLDQFGAVLQSRLAQEAARKASGLVVQRSYAFWSNPKMQTREVYKNDFASEKIGMEWSTSSLSSRSDDHADLHLSTTPTGYRRFLGEFGNQSALLALPNLPPHKEITISFDLFIIRTWDGNDPTCGPDLWSLSVVDGPTLIKTTFNNSYDTVDPRLLIQSYPGEYPEFHPCRTGADETNTLGYTAIYDKKPRNMDAVYHLRFTFPHTSSSIVFNFTGNDLQELTDESWGMTNVKVAVGFAPLALPVARPAVPTHHIAHTVPAVRRRPAQSAHVAHARPKAKPAVKKTHKPAQRLHELKKAPSP